MDDREPEQRPHRDARSRPDVQRENPVIKPLFTRTIDLGHILQAVVMSTIAVAYIVAISGSVGEANRKVDDLKTSVNAQFTDLRAELRTGLDGVHHQISGLPDTTARLTALERRFDEVDRTIGAVSARLDVTEQRSIQTQATLNSVLPATAVQLGPHKQ